MKRKKDHLAVELVTVDREWRRKVMEILPSASVTVSRLQSALESCQGFAKEVQRAEAALRQAAMVCPNCGTQDDSHKDPFPCDVWDLLDLLYEGWSQVEVGDVVKPQHMTVLRKIWALRPERYEQESEEVT